MIRVSQGIRAGPAAFRLIAAALPLILCAGIAAADTPQALMTRGLRAYEEERFDEAAEAFRAAAEQAEGTRLDAARARYNLGNALFEQHRFREAAEAYAQALRSTDLELQQAAQFNRGNALLEEGLTLAEDGQLEPARDHTAEAMENFRNVLTLDPANRDAKINFELAERLREEIEERIAQQPPPPPQPEPQPGEQEGEEEEEEPRSEPAGEQPEPADADEPEPGDEPGETDASDPASPIPEPSDTMDEMTEEEAMLLLDALRDEEQQTRDRMRHRLGPPEEVEKDW